MSNDLTLKVNLLRSKNQNVMLTALTVLVAALFVSALLPSLLVRYLYAGQQLMAQPPLLEYVPVVSFAIGIGYFLIAAIGNSLRCKRIKYLLKEMNFDDCCCCGSSDKKMLDELKGLSESLVKKSAPKKESKTKKSSKKKKKTKSKKSKKGSESKK